MMFTTIGKLQTIANETYYYLSSALLILSVFSVTNLIDITSVEIIRGFEFLILGYGIITTESNFVSSSTGIDKLTVNSINEASRIIMYFLIIPLIVIVLIIPILIIFNELYLMILIR